MNNLPPGYTPRTAAEKYNAIQNTKWWQIRKQSIADTYPDRLMGSFTEDQRSEMMYIKSHSIEASREQNLRMEE